MSIHPTSAKDIVSALAQAHLGFLNKINPDVKDARIRFVESVRMIGETAKHIPFEHSEGEAIADTIATLMARFNACKRVHLNLTSGQKQVVNATLRTLEASSKKKPLDGSNVIGISEAHRSGGSLTGSVYAGDHEPLDTGEGDEDDRKIGSGN